MLWPELTLQQLLEHRLMPGPKLVLELRSEPTLGLKPVLQLGPRLRLELELKPELELRPRLEPMLVP